MTIKSTKSRKKWRENIQRAQRIRALRADKQPRAITTNLKDRIELFEVEFEARAAHALQFAPVTMYCRKTGATIGQVSQEASALTSAIYNELPDSGTRERSLQTYMDNQCHPAWFNTSHDNLAALQRLMPHEYCVYVRNLLLKTNDTAEERSVELADIYISASHALIIEYAELLRRAMAMFGKYKDKCKVLPDLPFTNVPVSLDNLRQWITHSIKKVQIQNHHAEIDRQHVVTLADVKGFQFDLGSRLFREACIATAEDDALLIDVAEIFAESVVAQEDGMSTAWTYHPPALNYKEPPKFSGRVHTSSDSQSVATPAERQPTETPQTLKPIRLF